MEPVLVIPYLDKEMRVEVDTLDFVIRGVLSIKYKDKKWRPVAYISNLLKEITKFITKRCWQSLGI